MKRISEREAALERENAALRASIDALLHECPVLNVLNDDGPCHERAIYNAPRRCEKHKDVPALPTLQQENAALLALLAECRQTFDAWSDCSCEVCGRCVEGMSEMRTKLADKLEEQCK